MSPDMILMFYSCLKLFITKGTCEIGHGNITIWVNSKYKGIYVFDVTIQRSTISISGNNIQMNLIYRYVWCLFHYCFFFFRKNVKKMIEFVSSSQNANATSRNLTIISTFTHFIFILQRQARKRQTCGRQILSQEIIFKKLFLALEWNRTLYFKSIWDFVRQAKISYSCCTQKAKNVAQESALISTTQCGKMKYLPSPKKYFVKSTL